MVGKIILRTSPYGLSLVLVVTWAVIALAGGFWISVEAPGKTDASLTDAVVIVRPYGCHRPSDAMLSGTAEGLVNGRRQSVPLQFAATSKGVYAVRQQWPSQGVWVLAITGTYNGHTSSALVEIGADGRVQLATGNGKDSAARTVSRKFSAGEIEAALKALASKSNQSARASR